MFVPMLLGGPMTGGKLLLGDLDLDGAVRWTKSVYSLFCRKIILYWKLLVSGIWKIKNRIVENYSF
jgi:hypothetical protein